ncbi:MAG TPA: hypothetical protein VIE43_09730 [Thermoanaerobaculia bacterium]|nr:hypothetical protein [Thermoanaerobaculia bacterium]
MPESEVSPRLARALLVLASAFLALALVCAWGWQRAARQRTSLAALSPAQRQALAREMIAVSPGVFVPALFEPAIAYTLRPAARITAWGDAFDSNELGYRTPSPPGRRGGEKAFRVLFLGDSWTYGMGIREAESFPARFAELAGRLGAGKGRPVRAFNLALPGYNTLNEIAALDFFYDLFRPDAVVICPTANDADSSAKVLPDGSLTTMGVERDDFGADQPLVYPRLVDSFVLRSRWRRDFDEIRWLDERLRARGVPLLIYFTATWDEPFAHSLIAESGITAPYLITPHRLASPRWRNPAPFFHGTPPANRLYARMVYRGLAELLGWPQAPAPATPDETEADVPLRRRPPAAADTAGLPALLAAGTAELPERYAPGPDADPQCVGTIECETGQIGKVTTVLVRRRAGATRVEVALRRLPNAPSLLPLAVRVSIPSPGGGTEARAELSASSPDPLIVRVPIPTDLPAGAALDVTVHAAHAVSAPSVLAPRSLGIAGIEQN